MITRRIFFPVLAFLFLAACAGNTNVPRIVSWTLVDLDEADALNRVNALRAETELTPLSLDPTLSSVTRQYAQALASNQDSNREFASKLKELLNSQGYPHGPASVLFEINSKSYVETFDNWLDSANPGEGMLDDGIIHMSIAAAERLNEDTYYIMVLTTPIAPASDPS